MQDYEHRAMHRERVRDQRYSIRRNAVPSALRGVTRRLVGHIRDATRRIAEYIKIGRNGCVDRVVPCK